MPSPTMDADLVRSARMASLLLAGHPLQTAGDVARWFGALQAQDAASGQWSLGVRLPLDLDGVNAAFEAGEVVRTWAMRGTIHIVAAEDVRWLLDLTGVRAVASSTTRRTHLGISERDLEVAAAALAERLAGGQVATRAETLACLREAGLDTDGQRGYHLLWHTAHHGLICIGPQRGADQTFVLVADWAPVQRSLSREEALVELAHRYFRSHGPTTVRDFAGWSGLTLTDARAGTLANDGRLTRWSAEPDDLWLATELDATIRESGPLASPTVVLPGFDEYLLGYKDRSLQLRPRELDRIVPGGNGIFRATVVRQGRVIASWTRGITASTVRVAVEPFAPLSATVRRETDAAFARYGEFLGRDVRVMYGDGTTTA